jgi:hypothetical protein
MKEKQHRELKRRKIGISANKEKPSSTTTRCSQYMIRLTQNYVEKKLIATQEATLACRHKSDGKESYLSVPSKNTTAANKKQLMQVTTQHPKIRKKYISWLLG